MKSTKALGKTALLGVFFALLLSSGCANDEPVRPNIVLITIDTLRADRLGAYGYDKGVTPHLDELADGGVVFERAVTTAGTTWPAHASMLSGLYPRYHGLRQNGLELNDDVPLVSQLLTESGYSTGSFVSFKGMHFRGQLDRGFQTASDSEFKESDEPAIREGQATTQMALDWLDEQAASSPAFMWLHLFEPHAPYDLTEYSREWLAASDYEGFMSDGASGEEVRGRIPEIVSSPEHVAAMNALYDGEIKVADALVGKVIEKLRANGRLANSIVIVASDHGQGLGEDGNMGHGATLREDVLHIPLIIRDFRSNQGGRRVADTVSAIDFAPTIASAALDIDLPGVQGQSLMPYLQDTPRESEPRELFAEVELKSDLENAPDWYDHEATALYADGLKFVERHEDVTVFDPRRRPSSETRLNSPSINESFVAYLDSLRDEFLAGEIETEEVQLTDDEIETLKSLGYIQ